MTNPGNTPLEVDDQKPKIRFVGYFCSLGILVCGIIALFMVSCSREEATLAASYFKPTPTPVPGTPTFTPTPTPFIYEDFDGTPPDPNGNCWEAISPCPSVSGGDKYLDDDYQSLDAAVTLTFNTNAAFTHIDTNSEQVALTITSNAGQAAWGISSEYGSACGGALSIPAGFTTANSTLTYWMYPITQDGAPLTFVSVMYVGGYCYYQNGTGSDVQLSEPSGQWSQVSLPLVSADWNPALPANSTAWSVTYIETWVLHSAGVVPYGALVYLDDYQFNP